MIQTPTGRPLIFADSSVFVEALFVEDSCAAILIRLVASGQFALTTCGAVMGDVERAIVNKTRHSESDALDVLKRWAIIVKETNLALLRDADANEIRSVFEEYLPIMRHRNDIPILAVALRGKPEYIVSNNREHFNDAVSEKCGIKIVSCPEFVGLVTGTFK